MLTARQIDLIQDSFALVLPATEHAAAEFYCCLFNLAPDTRMLFKGDMADQGRKLFLTLATIVDALDGLETILPVAEALAVRHVTYGVQEKHYAAVGEALIATMRQALGERFDDETELSWVEAYGTLSKCMIAAAYPAHLHAMLVG